MDMVLRRRQRGYTLVEALVAAGILLIVAVGILPLFAQAIINNKQGGDSTTVTTFSRTNVETLLPIPYDAPAVTVPAGSTSLVTTDWYVLATPTQVGGSNGKWIVGTTPPTGQGQVLWKRITTVEYFNVNDLTFSTPLDGGTTAGDVNLKRITVAVQRPVGVATQLAAGKVVSLQTMKVD